MVLLRSGNAEAWNAGTQAEPPNQPTSLIALFAQLTTPSEQLVRGDPVTTGNGADRLLTGIALGNDRRLDLSRPLAASELLPVSWTPRTAELR